MSLLNKAENVEVGTYQGESAFDAAVRLVLAVVLALSLVPSTALADGGIQALGLLRPASEVQAVLEPAKTPEAPFALPNSIDSANFADSTSPTSPASPANTADLVNPTDLANPAGSTTPANAADPSNPANLTNAADPSDLANPTGSANAASPAEGSDALESPDATGGIAFSNAPEPSAVPQAPLSTQGDAGVVYSQTDGFEPYSGWQSVEDPAARSGGGTSAESGYVNWMLTSPASLGVVTSDGSSYSYNAASEVNVVVDTAACTPLVKTADEQGVEKPAYFKNVILPTQALDSNGDGTVDENDAIAFELLVVSVGGRVMDLRANYDAAAGTGGVVVSTSPNPTDWADAGKVLWAADSTNSSVSNNVAGGNWQNSVTLRVGSLALAAAEDAALYLVIENGVDAGNSTNRANVVFEFRVEGPDHGSTNAADAVWQGDTARAGGVSAQGDALVLGMIDPAPANLKRDLTVADHWRNVLADGVVVPDSSGNVGFTLFASASGSNWQSLDTWNAHAFGVFDDDPISNPKAICVADNKSVGGVEITSTDRIWGDGATFTISGLSEGSTYYFCVPAGFTAGKSSPLGRAIVFAFTLPGDTLAWEVGSPNPGDVVASYLPSSGTLKFSLAKGVETSDLADFAFAAAAPWADIAKDVRSIRLCEGLTSIGANSFAGLSGVSAVSIPASTRSIGVGAFADGSLVAADLSACSSLAEIGEGAFCQDARGLTVYVPDDRVAALVMAAAGSSGAWSGGNVNPATTALAITNGGTFPANTEFAASVLAAPVVREGFDFANWYIDSSTMHVATEWKPISQHVTYYAKLVERSSADEPVAYTGRQGLDQTVTLLDPSALPSAVTAPGITTYPETGERYENRFDAPLNGNDDLVFAFTTGRGTNANGGDGSYVLSFTLGYVSILDADGALVASYDGGAGDLELVKVVFDDDMKKTTGNSVTAIEFGVAARTLPAGAYTLRFGRDIGSNNGQSKLGKDVDFLFEVDRPDEYTLSYSDDGRQVVGCQVLSDRVVDVEIPADAGITSIAPGAFEGLANVASVSVPSSVASVGDRAFADMPDLVEVKVLSHEATSPVFGDGVFDGTGSAKTPVALYGFAVAFPVRDVANRYYALTGSPVVWHPLDDGIYGTFYEGDTDFDVVCASFATEGDMAAGRGQLVLNATFTTVSLSVIKDGEDITSKTRGYVSNTGVVGHPSTEPGYWHELEAQANGTCELEVRTRKGELLAIVDVSVTGFPSDAAAGLVPLEGGQGNGCTIRITGLGLGNEAPDITYAASDERAALYYSDYIGTQVPAAQATFTLVLAGPGNAWGIDRWNWDDWTANHLNPYLSLRDSLGATLATVGNGLYWVSLTDSNEIVLGVEAGVMSAGESYTLVADARLTGHNVVASLLKEVRWTFTTRGTDVADLSLQPSSIPSQAYSGSAIRPDVALVAPVPETRIWSTAEAGVVVTPASTRTLEQGVDYTVSYGANVNAGEGAGKVTVHGRGSYSGSLTRAFTITRVAQELQAKGKKVTLSAKALKKKGKKKVGARKLFAVSGAASSAKLSYTLTSLSANKKKRVLKKVKKKFSIAAKTGKLTVKRGVPKGTYKLKVRVAASQTTNYDAASKVVVVKVKVRR